MPLVIAAVAAVLVGQPGGAQERGLELNVELSPQTPALGHWVRVDFTITNKSLEPIAFWKADEWVDGPIRYRVRDAQGDLVPRTSVSCYFGGKRTAEYTLLQPGEASAFSGRVDIFVQKPGSYLLELEYRVPSRYSFRKRLPPNASARVWDEVLQGIAEFDVRE